MQHPLVAAFEQRRAKHFTVEIEKRESRERNRATARNPIASNINRECLREMVLAMKHPLEKIVRDVDRLERFEDAIDVAKRTRRELEDFGFEVSDVESAIPPVKGRHGETILTGVIDFLVRFDGKRYPVEVKSPHPIVFEKLDSLEDFDRFWWTRKWIDQTIAYLLAHGLEEGFVLLVALGAKKWIHVDLGDPALLDRAESALEVAEDAAAAYARSFKAGELPPFAKDPVTCRSCWAFGVVCQPPIEEQAAGRIDDEEFYAMSLRALEVKPFHSEYEALWKKITGTVKAAGAERIVCRDLAFTVTEKSRKGYEVKPTTYREVKMFKAGARESEEGVA